MRRPVPDSPLRPVVEAIEARTMASASPSLQGQWTFPTHTELTVDAGALGQPITFHVTVVSADEPVGQLALSGVAGGRHGNRSVQCLHRGTSSIQPD